MDCERIQVSLTLKLKKNRMPGTFSSTLNKEGGESRKNLERYQSAIYMNKKTKNEKSK